MPEPFRLHMLACTKRRPSATSPKFQPSPSNCTSRPSSVFRRALMASMTERGWWPMMSKRKLAILYSRAHSSTESLISLPIIRCSVAVFSQQVLVSMSPFSLSRW